MQKVYFTFFKFRPQLDYVTVGFCNLRYINTGNKVYFLKIFLNQN